MNQYALRPMHVLVFIRLVQCRVCSCVRALLKLQRPRVCVRLWCLWCDPKATVDSVPCS